MDLHFDQQEGNLVISDHCNNVFFITENNEELCVDMIGDKLNLTYEGNDYINKDGELVPTRNTQYGETINDKVRNLLALTTMFPYIEYYPHENAECFKIKNEYTDFKNEVFVLGRSDVRFDKILDEAIKVITKKKEEYENLPF